MAFGGIAIIILNIKNCAIMILPLPFFLVNYRPV